MILTGRYNEISMYEIIFAKMIPNLGMTTNRYHTIDIKFRVGKEKIIRKLTGRGKKRNFGSEN